MHLIRIHTVFHSDLKCMLTTGLLQVNTIEIREDSAGLQIYGGPGSFAHDFKNWPITFQDSGPSGPNPYSCEKISF